MALLWIDGFDAYGVGSTSYELPTGMVGRRYGVNKAGDLRIGAGRFGGYAIGLGHDTGCGIYKGQLTTDGTVVIGFSVYFGMEALADCIFASLYDDATQGVCLYLSAAGHLILKRQGTLLASSVVNVIERNRWYHIELKCKCHSTAGTYEVRVDGVQVIKDAGGAINTQAGANAYHTAFYLNGINWGLWFDDLFFLDSTGSRNNNFLGTRKITTLFPTDVGDANAWTGSAEVDHYTLVDENPCDDDTTYIESSTSTQKELWTFDPITDVGSVSGIQVNTDCRETDANPFSLITVVKTLSESDDAGQAVGTSSYVTRRRLLETDPHDSEAWTTSRINDAQFGIKVA